MLPALQVTGGIALENRRAYHVHTSERVCVRIMCLIKSAFTGSGYEHDWLMY